MIEQWPLRVLLVVRFLRLDADRGQMEIALLRATGTGGACQIKLVAGERFILIVRRSSTSPISIAAKSGQRISQTVVVGDTR